MANVLIVSADPSIAADLEEVISSPGARVRLLATPATAREWLSMSQFDALFVDVRFDEKAVMDLVQLGWKYNPLMVCVAFSKEEDFSFKWDAAIAGVVILSGVDILEQARTLVENLPEDESFQKFQILLVEDLDAPRDIITTYIESLGFDHVTGVESVSEALKLLEENPTRFGCIVTDFSMPNQSGADLIAEVRRDETLNHLPIVVLTAYSTIETLIECIKAGATGFLVKPPRKKALRIELEKARRILFSKRSPRLCSPEEAHLLEEALTRKASR